MIFGHPFPSKGNLLKIYKSFSRKQNVFCIKFGRIPAPSLRGKPRGWFSWTRGRKLAKNTLSNYYYPLHDKIVDNPGGLIGRLLGAHFAISRKMGALPSILPETAGPRATIDQVRKGIEREK